MVKAFSAVLALVAVAASFSAAGAALLDMAATVPELSILVEVVKLAGLEDAVNALDDNTLLAPTNNAFINLLGLLNMTSAEEIPTETLQSVLLYHVLPGQIKSTKVPDGSIPTLLDGATLTAETEADGTVMFIPSSTISTAKVIMADVKGAPGVIVHIIDEVLVPEEALA